MPGNTLEWISEPPAEAIKMRVADPCEGLPPVHAPRIFLDIEASGLTPRSHPVELGWAVLNPDLSIDAAALLIKPAPSWPADNDAVAAGIHTLSFERLKRWGVSTERVVSGFLATVDGVAGANQPVEVFTDAAIHDGKWLNDLFVAAGMSDQADRFVLRAMETAFMDAMREAGCMSPGPMLWPQSQALPRMLQLRHRAAIDAGRSAFVVRNNLAVRFQKLSVPQAQTMGTVKPSDRITA